MMTHDEQGLQKLLRVAAIYPTKGFVDDLLDLDAGFTQSFPQSRLVVIAERPLLIDEFLKADLQIRQCDLQGIDRVLPHRSVRDLYTGQIADRFGLRAFEIVDQAVSRSGDKVLHADAHGAD